MRRNGLPPEASRAEKQDMIRSLLIGALTAAALASPVAAEDTDNWTVSFGGASDYRSKGTSKTLGEPYGWFQTEWRSDDELFYAEAGLASVKLSFGAELETEIRAGVRPEIAGFSFDLNAMYRYYPIATSGADDDYWEFTADASRSAGPVSGRLRLQYSPDNAGSSHAFTYYEARLGYKLTGKLRATAAIGHRDTEDSLDYTGWNAGVAYRIENNVDLDLRWYDTDQNSAGPQYEEVLVGAINFSF